MDEEEDAAASVVKIPGAPPTATSGTRFATHVPGYLVPLPPDTPMPMGVPRACDWLGEARFAILPTTASVNVTTGVMHPPVAIPLPNAAIPSGFPSTEVASGGHVITMGGGGPVVGLGVVGTGVVVGAGVVVTSVVVFGGGSVGPILTGGAGVTSPSRRFTCNVMDSPIPASTTPMKRNRTAHRPHWYLQRASN